MKKVHLLLSVLLVFALATGANSQTISLQGGLTLSNMSFETDNDWDMDDDTDWKAGFVVGAAVEFPFSDVLSLETGLFLASRGYKASEEYTDTWAGMTFNEEFEETLRLLYLDIPITARLSHDLGNGLGLYGVLGPYIGIGLTGTMEYEYTATFNGETETESGEEDIEWGSGDEDDLKRIDFGLKIGGGVEINNFLIGLSYHWGLADISPHDIVEIKNQAISFTVGYRF